MKYDSYKRMFKGVFQLHESEFIRKDKGANLSAPLPSSLYHTIV